MKTYKFIVAYIRVSSDKQDTSRQKAGIEAAALALGIVISKWYEDSDGVNSRDLAYKRKAFQQLLKDVQAGKIDCIIIDSQDRFGVKDGYEWGKFISLLRDHGCDLIDRAGKSFTDDDIATQVTSMVGAFTSQKEQIEKSHRNVSSKVLRAAAGNYQGGNPPYGFDVVCFDGEREKWRSVYIGHYQRLKMFPDGRREEFNGKDNSPRKDPTDTLRLQPNLDRIEIVQKIFEWFTTESISPGAIAKRLNSLGVVSVFTPMWYKHTIKAILENPIYLGRFVWNRTGKGRFTEFAEGSHRAVPKTGNEKVKARKRDESDFIQSEILFTPFITDEVWQATKDKLAESSSKPNGKRGRKATRNSALWLQPFLFCGKCGNAMHGHGGGNRIGPAYFCGTYNRYGKNNPTGCKCHRVPHDRVAQLVDSYLTKTAPGILRSLAESGSEAPEILAPMMAQLSELRQALADCHCDGHLLAEINEQTDYRTTLNLIRPAAEATIQAKEIEIEAALDAFLSLPKNLQERAGAKMQVMQDELVVLKSKLVDLNSPIDNLEAEIARRQADLNVAVAEISGTENGRRKAELLATVIDKVVLHFTYAGAAQRSSLAKVEIKAATGKDHIIEDLLRRVFVAEALNQVVQAEELAQSEPKTSRKGMKYKLSTTSEQRAAAGKRAAATRWSKAKERGSPDSRTPAERSEAGRRAALKVPADQRRANAKKAAAASPVTKPKRES